MPKSFPVGQAPWETAQNSNPVAASSFPVGQAPWETQDTTAAPTDTSTSQPNWIQSVAGALGNAGRAAGQSILNFALGPLATAGARTGELAAYGVGKGYAALTGNQQLSQNLDTALQQPLGQVPVVGTQVPGVQPGAAGVKQVGGEALNAALMYAPLGRVAAGAKTGLEAAGVASKVAGPLSTIGTGAAAGYGFDQASQLQQGKTPDLQPGMGTALGATIPAALEGLTKVHDMVFPPTVEENAVKALPPVGKTSLSQAAGTQAAQSSKGLAVLSRLAPDITVTDAQGIDKPFIPTKTSYQELPQALEKAKNMVYNAYTTLAKNAGDSGADFTQKDLYSIVDRLNALKSNATADIKSAVDRELANFTSMYSTFNTKQPGASLSDLQSYLESINRSVNPFSDAARATVSNEMSSAIRQVLDEKISKATGSQYQALRSEYGALKSIEPSVITQWKKSVKPGGISSNLLNAVGTVDFLQGLVTRSPSETARGLLWGGAEKGLTYLKGGEKNLRKAFSLIEGHVPESLAQKALNMTPGSFLSERGGAIENATSNLVKDSVQNLRDSGGGLAIKDVSGIPKELQPLAQEMMSPQQKGMAESAIKYAKEQGAPVNPDGSITLYHGTDAARAPKEGDTLRTGTYFTTDKNTALQFAKQGEGSKPIVMKVDVPAYKVFAGKGDGYWSLNEPTPLVTDFYNKVKGKK